MTASIKASAELRLNHTHRPQTPGEDTDVAANSAGVNTRLNASLQSSQMSFFFFGVLEMMLFLETESRTGWMPTDCSVRCTLSLKKSFLMCVCALGFVKQYQSKPTSPAYDPFSFP